SDVLSISIKGKGNADIHQMEKGSGRPCRFRHGNISVHAAALEQGFRHRPDTVRLTAAQGQLIVSLLVRAGISGSAHQHPLRHQGDLSLSQLIKPYRGSQPCGPCSHNDGIIAVKRYVLYLHSLPYILQSPDMESSVYV